jgi:prepilin-type N-terminal cleavage/methylation domain-containing protein
MVRKGGFTLSELLIALTVLAVISSFLIGKVLNTSTQNTTRAILRDKLSMVSAAGHAARLRGATSNRDVRFYFRDNLQYVSLDQSEWLYTFQDGSTLNETTTGGWSNANRMQFTLDANGDVPPNSVGEDRIAAVLCIQIGTHCATANSLGKFVFLGLDSTNRTYYELLFSN